MPFSQTRETYFVVAHDEGVVEIWRPCESIAQFQNLVYLDYNWIIKISND